MTHTPSFKMVEISAYVDPSKARGVKYGQLTFAKLRQKIEMYKCGTIVKLSLAGLDFIDVSFGRECLIHLLLHFRGRIGFILTNLEHSDLEETFYGALYHYKICLLIQQPDNSTKIIGPKSDGSFLEKYLELWNYISEHEFVTTSQIVKHFHALSPPNGNSKLNKLVKMGLLLKKRQIATSGGPEDIFIPIKN
ncbi:hypothetical protein [Pseudoalteromonas byunsanensis]|uniref:DNA-binding protein n=1 Tax=Pseudoalteromonas byunsanensis TaxID=327939 RepID=A0A1S1N3I8_9GAMM|nr:hypothetical protein [Pseudoalteromonas byunsanensis]OHU93944.1 hypothetical protein BIW53_17115 [Pseudoalteromonas byunsanensis]